MTSTIWLRLSISTSRVTVSLSVKPWVGLSSDTETGPGVFETALGYTEAFRMADNACLFKLVAKSVGMKHNIMPTFMAKPWGDVGSYPSDTHVLMTSYQGAPGKG